MIHCDNCHNEIDRHVFCDDKCRMQYVRKANKESITVRKANNVQRIVSTKSQQADPYKLCTKHKVYRVSCGCKG